MEKWWWMGYRWELRGPASRRSHMKRLVFAAMDRGRAGSRFKETQYYFRGYGFAFQNHVEMTPQGESMDTKCDSRSPISISIQLNLNSKELELGRKPLNTDLSFLEVVQSISNALSCARYVNRLISPRKTTTFPNLNSYVRVAAQSHISS